MRRVFEEGAYADRAIVRAAEGLDDRDRALAQRIAYGTVQRKRTIDHGIEKLALAVRSPRSTPPWSRRSGSPATRWPGARRRTTPSSTTRSSSFARPASPARPGSRTRSRAGSPRVSAALVASLPAGTARRELHLDWILHDLGS